MRIRKENPIYSSINSVIVDLPSPSGISYLWNFGSLLGLYLVIQILTGIFLAMHYCAADISLAFSSITHITRDVNYGFLLKYLHANGASAFFVCVYIHIGRGIYYGSYLKVLYKNMYILMFYIRICMYYTIQWHGNKRKPR